MIGLKGLLALLEHWIVTGPEISRVVEQFAKADNDSYDNEELPHHEEGRASQDRFRHHVADLLYVLPGRGNPFEEDSTDQVTLNNKVCINALAATSVRILEFTGQEQYDSFRKMSSTQMRYF